MADRVESAADQTDRPEPLTAAAAAWSALPSIRDVLGLPPLVDALPEVLAARDRLDAPVRWVHVSESLEVASLLDGGELLLTTGAGWAAAEEMDLVAFIEQLVQVAAAGLVVELSPRMPAVPLVLIDACERFGFPLILVHKVVKFVAVTEAVHRRIISAQTAALQARDDVRQLFTELSLRGSPPDFIVRQLSEALQSSVVLENLAHEVIAASGDEQRLHELLAQWPARSRHAHAVHDPGADAGWLAVPVEARGTRWGALIASPGQAHPAGRLAVLEQGAIALALGRLADREGDEWVRLSHQGLLDTLLGGRYRETGITARLEAAGFPVRGRTLVGVVLAPSVVDGAPATEPVSAAAITAAASVGGRGIGGLLGDRVVVCLSLPRAVTLGDRELRRFARELTAASGAADRAVTVGVGTVASAVPGLLSSVQEALDLVARVPGAAHHGPVIYRAEDRPLLTLVTGLRDDPRLQEHAQRALKPLVDHDRVHDGDLLAVLAAVLAHPTNRTAAANASHLSRSVFYQRIELIQDLLGADLTDGETLASLQVAMLAR